MMPIGPLMIEHRLIERMITQLERERDSIHGGSTPDIQFLRSAVDFLRNYADRTHHGKEEDILFRDLKEKPLSPKMQAVMEKLVRDHERSRENTGALLAAIDEMDDGEDRLEEIERRLHFLTDLYPEHIRKEDKDFFIQVMELFTREEMDNMLDEFLEFDRKMIHERYGKMVDRFEKEE
jgi:hemerythrin-like domain-containing protein